MKILLIFVSLAVVCAVAYGATTQKGHRDNSMFYSNVPWLKLTSSPSFLRYAQYKILGVCDATRKLKPCGGYVVTKYQCYRFGCCWDETSNYCYKSKFHVLNYLEKNGTWNEWSQWSACSATLCSAGTQTRTRTCTGGTAGVGGCPGESSETQACSTCGNTWSTWGAWGVCSSSDSTCLVGSQSRTRTCVNSGGVVQSSASCTGGAASASATQACNTNLCSQFSGWTTGTCTLACGSGTKTQTRTCTTTPTATLPSSCYSTSTVCNTHPCSQDKNLDLMILLDSTNELDDCATKSQTLSFNAPFHLSSGLLTATNFPNFFQQNAMATSILSSWKTITAGMTQVGILQQSSQCSISTPSTLNSLQTFGSTYNSAAILQSSYLCGSDHRFTQLSCGVASLNSALNRAGTPDVIVQFLPDMTKISSAILGVYRALLPTVATTVGSKRLLVVSAANHATLTAAQVQTNVLFAQQWACGSVTPTLPCSSYYLGTIYDTAGVLASLRAAVYSL